MSERELQRAIIHAIELSGLGHPIRMNAGTMWAANKSTGKAAPYRVGEAGTPDILVMLTQGQVVWFEVKTAKGKLQPSQVAWHERARGMGHAVFIVRSQQEALAALTGRVNDGKTS